jgi:ParB-like chromosome segregation protein Spo0J
LSCNRYRITHLDLTMSRQYVEARIAQIDPDSRIRQLEENLKRRESELLEYVRAEKVLVAAGHVTQTKIGQAHEIVRGLD